MRCSIVQLGASVIVDWVGHFIERRRRPDALVRHPGGRGRRQYCHWRRLFPAVVAVHNQERAVTMGDGR